MYWVYNDRMIPLDDLVTQTATGWEWHIPPRFNIARACVRQHIERGHGSDTALVV